MKCPKCGALEDRVVDSRSIKEGTIIRRRRECDHCTHRFTTYEEIEREDIRIIKKDGRYEPFDKRKLFTGLERACEKRPISLDVIQTTIDELMADLIKVHGREIPAMAIGEGLMERLRQLDEIAYVRFASVYRKFRDIKEFVSEVQNLTLQ